jgi:mannose-1-phosphate guanylyltransferase/mannose-6-phosphate isomerase
LSKNAVSAVKQVVPFILCGGAGTRLWPISRESFPKQFQKLFDGESLFQQTLKRLTAALFANPFVIANSKHRFLVAEQLEEIPVNSTTVVLEPVGRNTAPAACTAALLAAQDDPDNLVLLVPADHVIADSDMFAHAVSLGIAAAVDGALVTFGVEPDCPHTGYGYIETERGNSPDLKVRRFVEKPSRQAAEEFLATGGFYWNAGIFLFRASALIALLEVHAPSILEICRRSLAEVRDDLGFLRLGPTYKDAPSISLDYAVAEKANTLRCLPLNTPWSDVGSWSALWSLFEKDDAGNVSLGEGEILLEGTSGSLAYSSQALVAVVGLKDVVVSVTEDAVLVMSKDYSETVKSIVERLKANGRTHTLDHLRVYRPWGWYQALNQGERYQVKCIMVKPGGILSLQSHFHRSEHWVVVKGTLEVTKGEKIELLSENQSTYIPIGERHRLTNPGRIPAFLIEVQSGSYLNEDDIVRFEDVYGRVSDDLAGG